MVTGFCHHYLCDSFPFVLLKEKRKPKKVNLHVSAVQSDEGRGTGVTQGSFTSLKHSSALCLAASVPYPLGTQLTFTSFLDPLPGSGAVSPSSQPCAHCACLCGPTDCVSCPQHPVHLLRVSEFSQCCGQTPDWGGSLFLSPSPREPHCIWILKVKYCTCSFQKRVCYFK